MIWHFLGLFILTIDAISQFYPAFILYILALMCFETGNMINVLMFLILLMLVKDQTLLS